jgi:uncharacterized Tic20 family protein
MFAFRIGRVYSGIQAVVVRGTFAKRRIDCIEVCSFRDRRYGVLITKGRLIMGEDGQNLADAGGVSDSAETEGKPAAQEGQAVPAETPTSKDARMWAMFCHLAGLAGYVIPVILSGIIAPLIVWQVKKEEDSFIDVNGREALNFQISIGIYALVSVLLIPVFCTGVFLLAAVSIFDLVFIIIAALKANNGEQYKYPLTIRFVK